MKKRTIIDIFLIILLLVLLIFLGKKDYSKETEGKDSKRFDKDYSMVSNDNNFKYITEEELYDKMQKENIVVFMGFKENEWCNYYAKILNEVATEKKVEVYYYDFLADREKQSVTYKKIVKYLEDYLYKDDMGKVNLVAPSLLIIKNKNVFLYDKETSTTDAKVKPKDYWNEENINYKKEVLREVFDTFLASEEDLGVDLGGTNGGEE